MLKFNSPNANLNDQLKSLAARAKSHTTRPATQPHNARAHKPQPPPLQPFRAPPPCATAKQQQPTKPASACRTTGPTASPAAQTNKHPPAKQLQTGAHWGKCAKKCPTGQSQQQQAQQQTTLPINATPTNRNQTLARAKPQTNSARPARSSSGGMSSGCAPGGLVAGPIAQPAGPGPARHQLAGRVKWLTGKLLDSHGAERRRTLFSLGQIFQDEPELGQAFADSNGFDCLLRLAREEEEDQIHQNYILKGGRMACLARNNELLEWLYSLLASQRRPLVKSALKLLVAFVGESEQRQEASKQLCGAIEAVDKSKGAPSWTNVIELLKQDQQQQIRPNCNLKAFTQPDCELLLDCMNLINQTLDQLPQEDEQDETYFSLIEALEEAGMESIIEKYSNLDSQLRRQFQLYEQKLASDEDEEEQETDNEERVCGLGGGGAIAASRGEAPGGERMASGCGGVARRHQPQPSKVASLSSGSSSTSNPDEGNEYESANDEQAPPGNGPAASPRHLQSQSTSSNATSTTPKVASGNKLVQTLNEEHHQPSNRRHQLQLRSQPAPQHQRNCNPTSTASKPTSDPAAPQQQLQNNLARGKHQRASISSCSSSDSYASYGSGYASGSANSSDHEHNKAAARLLQNGAVAAAAGQQADNNKEHDKDNLGALTAQINNLSLRAGSRAQDATPTNNIARANPKPAAAAATGDDDTTEDEGESQLKQHLSELEQLTDELAKRDIYSKPGTGKAAAAATSANDARRHPSANKEAGKAGGSAASSLLSTGSSDISSLPSSGINSPGGERVTPSAGAHQFRQREQSSAAGTQPSLVSDKGGESSSSSSSRSASATPTSAGQPPASKTPAACPANSAPAANSNPNCSAARAGSLARPANQYAAATPPPALPSSVGSRTALQEKLNKSAQESSSYHHNLFQWEQLVSKGVTRPLLINDLDFTDLRDEDDCDLLQQQQQNPAGNPPGGLRRPSNSGEPLTISIPAANGGRPQLSLDHADSADSGASTGSPSSRSINGVVDSSNGVPTTPASAPPPLPPPPISPWFNTIAGSRPQSQFMSSPSPPPPAHLYSAGGTNRDQSPAASTYSSYSSRNSVCLTSGAAQPAGLPAASGHHFNTMQPLGNLRSASSMSSLLFGNNNKFGNKRKKTMKLFWKEVREDRSLLSKLTKKKTIWDEIKPVHVDTQKLEYLFESKAKDLSLSKSRTGLDGLGQRKVKITVLDAKRSNAINIGMTKLPPMRTIKSAILKMDSSIMNREGIEKILTTMMPTEEEKTRIIEAQLANPDTPLGTAEQFLLNLASISALEARLKLWAFQLDYAQIEKEVAEPLMDLKQAIEEIERSETFRNILGTLLSIGNFLNSTNVKGFQIDYLEKVPEVKDTVHKHSLLHHLCLFIQEKFDPELSSDLYSEFSAVNRASKVDYTEVAKNLKKMQQDCKASWDHLKIVAKHDGLANLMNTCGNIGSSTSSTSSGDSPQHRLENGHKSSGKLNNLSKLSMITTVIGSENSSTGGGGSSSGGATGGAGGQSADQQGPTTKQLKMKVSDFLTDCAERIMVLMVIHRRVMNRFQKLLVYLGCPSHQIKQTQPQQILKIINEFALEYRTKRERVREMLARKQQCQHHHHNHHHHLNNQQRWQMNRMRWAGSQQCIDSMGMSSAVSFTNGANATTNRPCSTASSCASSSYAGLPNNCAECARGLQGNQQIGGGSAANNHRPGSPSGLSQISNFSDYLLDQTCCSRQDSITPVPLGANGRRPHSMSVSMLDLQNQQHHNGGAKAQHEVSPLVNKSLDESEMLARQKDEQMRRLLGAGKSLDGACQDLYQMSHWSSTMARVTRHHPPLHKQRAASIDPQQQQQAKGDSSEAKENEDSFNSNNGSSFNDSMSPRRQSSYYRYLHHNGSGAANCHVLEDEQNSDEEILQSLVRTVTARGGRDGHHHHNHSANNSHSNRSSLSGAGGDKQQQLDDSVNSTSSNRSAKSKILSRFSCDRKSYRVTAKNA